MLAAAGPEGPQLYMIEPSGVAWVMKLCHSSVTPLHVLTGIQGYHGCAVGKAKQAAKTEIEKLKVFLPHLHHEQVCYCLSAPGDEL